MKFQGCGEHVKYLKQSHALGLFMAQQSNNPHFAKHLSHPGSSSFTESRFQISCWTECQQKECFSYRLFHSCSSRCSVCFDLLTNWYFEKEGKLYCHKHYCEKFGELCHGCSLLMTGPAMVRKAMWKKSTERVKKLTISRKVLRKDLTRQMLTCERTAQITCHCLIQQIFTWLKQEV